MHKDVATGVLGESREPREPREPQIAVVGMSGRFPGADDIHQFWTNISTGVESFTTFTEDELLAAGVDPAQVADPAYVRSRPVLNQIRGFDAGFFGLNPREAALADPQQRLFTECAWEALEVAGYGAPDRRGAVGVFAGTNISTYLYTRPNRLRSSGVDLDALMAGNDKDSLATTVSYRLDLRGPSVAVQTFCSTSLVSVHLACASLRRDECDLAIAGGVSIRLPDRVGYLYQEGNQASPDGHVRTFDAGARGSMFGDGVAVVALKRLDRAMADRDTVLAVIRGSAMNNDGALKFSYHAPSIEGQRRCVTAALASAGVDADELSYVEAHGTATEVGDPMEVAALSGAFGRSERKQYCLLGSVKPNVGHLDRASGATGLIKVIQSLRHELIPGTRNYTSPNPEIDFENSPFRVTADPTPWPVRADRVRIAGVSSLGTGGTNCHAVVTEAPAAPQRPPRPHRWQVLPVSARWADGADQACTALARDLRENPDRDLGDVAYTLQVGRKQFGHRRVVVADSVDGAVGLFDSPAGALGRVDATVGRGTTFLIAGVGEQYQGMVTGLYRDEPEFRADVDECVELLGLGSVAELGDLFTAPDAVTNEPDLVALMGRGETPCPTADPDAAQPAVFVAEYALARQLMRWGVTPALMVGYSLGEYVAACLSGVLSLADAVRTVAFRARLITAMPAGAMLAVAADEQSLPAALGALWPGLDVAVRTGSQLVVAGPVDVVEAAAQTLRSRSIGCRMLATSRAYHSRLLAPAAAELTDWIAKHVELMPPQLPYLSNVTGGPATAELVTDPGYWARHMCETVEFGAGLQHALDDDHAFVEIGAGQSLGALARAHPACAQSSWPLIVSTVPAAAEQRDVARGLADAVARLWLTGVSIDWPALHSGWQPGRVPLPTYPFERREHWVDADAPGAGNAQQFDLDDPTAMLTGLPRLADTDWINVRTWRQTTARAPQPILGNWLVFTDSGLAGSVADTLADTLAAHLSQHLRDASVTFIRPGTEFAAGPDGLVVRPGSAEDLGAALRHLTARGAAPDRVVHLWGLGDASGADAVRNGLDTLIAFARATGDIGLPPWSLDVVTRGSHRVHAADPVRAEQATALGPCRLIPVEYPGVRARLIDVDEATVRNSARAVLAELCATPDDQVVAMRGGRRWIPEHGILDPAADPDPVTAFRPGGTYLVTGGLGGIGLAMAERIALDYRANLVLLGRTPVPAREHWASVLAAAATGPEVRRRISGLQRIAAAGAGVVTVAGDVSRPDDARRAVAAAVDTFGGLDGVLHCAGVPAVGLMQFKSAADVAGVLAPKLGGALALADALRGLSPDFIALFSSTTSTTGGGAGQVDYCAANAFLDAFAESDPVPGCHVASLDWGEWTWNGWTSGLDKYDEGSRQFFEQYRETFGITFDQGWQVLQRVLATGEHHVVVSTQDFPTMVAMSRRASIASHQETVRRARDASGRHPRPELSTPFVEPRPPTETAIAEVWARALGLKEVGSHDNFFELGGNSLVGMEIIAEVRKALDVPYLPPHLLYQAPTVATLAQAAIESGDAEPNADADSGNADASARAKQQSRIEQRRTSLRTRRTA